MSSQRHSCDRCRQQKVRCLKNQELPAMVGGSRDRLTPCERCAKADVPCVYSEKQKSRRVSHKHRRDMNATSPLKSMGFNHDMVGMLSRSNESGSMLGDATMPLLDIGETMAMSSFDDGDQYGWNNDTSLSSIPSLPLALPNGGDVGIEHGLESSPEPPRNKSKEIVETLTGQAMSLSTRATHATRQLDRENSTSTPLTVNSPVVNEAFEAANALARIINNITLASFPSASAQSLSRDDSQLQPITDSGLAFLALGSHQHVLALFRAICSSIERSIWSIAPGGDQQQQDLHGDGASSAQFVMVLQLIMHLTNRLGRSLRIECQNIENSSKDAHISSGIPPVPLCELMPELEAGSENSNASSVVDIAQGMLNRLPDEHAKLRQTIQRLQTQMEERLHTY